MMCPRLKLLRQLSKLRNTSHYKYSTFKPIKNKFNLEQITLNSATKFYSTNSIIKKITSAEYEKFYYNDSLRHLNHRTCVTSELKDFSEQKVQLVGWINKDDENNVLLYDGHGKVQCLWKNSTETEQNTKNLKSNDLVNVIGTVQVNKHSNDCNILLDNITLIKVEDTKIKIDIISHNEYTNRTHTCGELRRTNIGERVNLCGWLQYQRLNKFLLLRDSYGIIQCVVTVNTDMSNIPLESVLQITGTVCARPADMMNPTMTTGDIEVIIDSFEVLNLVEDIPFTLRKHQKPKEQLRLQYRYVDLRYEEMQNNLRLRSQMLHNMRKFLVERHSFVEVETPTLFCRTPGGAREFVVPTHSPGLFYSLVQSPQQFKQMLMVGGVDRYFQIARCYRDEATRPDRQPEFTQLDIEVSFTSVDRILKLIEDLLYVTYPFSVSETPFQRITYKEALETYGSDKPDISFGLKLNNISSCIENVNSIQDFASYAIEIPKEIGRFTTKTKELIKKLRKRYLKVAVLDLDKLERSIQNDISGKLQLDESKTLFIAAGPNEDVCHLLGELRIHLAKEIKSINLLEPSKTSGPIWIVDFPLFTRNENGELETCHHPFTAPHPEDIHLLETEPLKVRSLAYDLVLNGNEIGGGSIRIHNAELQLRVLKMLNIDPDTMGHFLKALKSGCPPHGGIALGIDRMMAIVCDAESIRDVIAFPKSHEGKDPLSGAPHCISESDKEYYHLKKNL